MLPYPPNSRGLSLVALTLILTACGGGQDGTETASPTRSGTATTASAHKDAGDGALSTAVASAVATPVPAVSVTAVAATQKEDTASTVTVPQTQLLPGAPQDRRRALDLYVALNGNDAWSGRLAAPNATLSDGPLRTVQQAQSRVRAHIAAIPTGTTRRPIQVSLMPGEYRLGQTLTFGPEDSGAPNAPVVYRAHQAGTVTLSGAVHVGNATPAAAGALVNLPAPALDTVNARGGSQLYVNGKRATLARSPNVGQYWFVQRAVPLAGEPANAPGREAFEPPAPALALLNGLSAADRSAAIVNVYQSWTTGWHRLSSQGSPAGSVRVTPRAEWSFLHFGADQRFYVENVAAALDAPGEWLWDAQGVRYIATQADAGRTLSFEMPQLDRLIVVQGNAATGAWVQDLEFRDLGFAHTRQITPATGYVDNQAGSAVGAVVEVNAARRVVVDGCVITRTGGYGVWLRGHTRDSQVSNCRMQDLGAGGVKLGLALQAPGDAQASGNNTATGNSIVDTGKVVPGAVGIWIGQSSGNTVSNNLIANTTYTGISVGWHWGYGPSRARDNLIRDNLLLNIGQGRLTDMGGIYTLGESPGTVISGNVIREVRPYPGYGAGAWGLYNDAASSDILWERNIVVGTSHGGYVANFGRRNTVRENLLAFGDHGDVHVGVSDPQTMLRFDRNLLIPKNVLPLIGFATAPDVMYTDNHVSGRVLAQPPDITKCGDGCERSNALLVVGADPRDVSIVDAAPNTADWVPMVASRAGPAWLQAAQIPPVMADLPEPYVAPPIAWRANIGDTPIGGRPVNMRYIDGGIADSISVQPAAGTASGKCLRLQDSAAIQRRWEPFAWAQLNHDRGISTVEFSIRIDGHTNFWHEWRDDDAYFLTGPSLRVKPTGVEINGAVVAPAPVGQWLTLSITAGVGEDAGMWTLQVRYSDGHVVDVAPHPTRSPGWQRLNWLGFISDASVSSNSCIGHITASNSLN